MSNFPNPHGQRPTSLSLRGRRNVGDLRFLAGQTQLTTLDLSHCNSVSNLSPLAGLTGLTMLDLSYCDSVSDLSLPWLTSRSSPIWMCVPAP
jgi:Leucine-rich repeat (LRR) protein